MFEVILNFVIDGGRFSKCEHLTAAKNGLFSICLPLKMFCTFLIVQFSFESEAFNTKLSSDSWHSFLDTNNS